MKPGDRFGRWTVTSEPFCREGRREPHVHAVCDCGAPGTPRVYNLVRGLSRQCRPCGQSIKPTTIRAPVAVGERFGQVVTVERIGKQRFRCECDCGGSLDASTSNLISGRAFRCRSCANAAISGEASPAFRHGMTGSPEYRSWVAAIRRCHDESNVGFEFYGARGIAVADEWRGSGGFEAFFAHIGPKPTPRHSLDRLDNERGYEPGNVRWATWAQQARNRRNNVRIPLGGDVLTLEEAGSRLGISRQAVQQRIAAGWTKVEAATYPRGQKPARFRGRTCTICGERGHYAKTCQRRHEERAA